jgi:hypothetical protein
MVEFCAPTQARSFISQVTPMVANIVRGDFYIFRNETVVLYINVTVLHRKNFFLNSQPDTLIIPILFCYKTLHVSGIFSTHHQEFSTLCWALRSILTLLGSGHQKPA